MNFLTKKKSIQKIIITCVFLILFNFIVPTYSQAGIGGTLSAPVVGLICVICDAINCLMANFMVESQNVFTVYPDKDWDTARDYIKANPYKADDALPTIIMDPGDFIGDYGIPILKYTPAQIFSGRLPSLDVNFFRDDIPDTTEEPKSVVAHLRGVVSSWYVALRNLALVGLLSVLIYLGIRMIITSSNAEKAKYKQSIVDWLVAMCLIFFLHYIMAFTLTMTEAITDMISNDDIKGNEVYVGILKSSPEEKPENNSNILTKEEAEKQNYISSIDEEESFATTLMGAARIQCEYQDGGKKWGYLILYVALTVYTIMFTFTYLKRLINMIFLTIIAPLVALTYPLDKAGDSKAQAFSFWLKEYIYNALIQPVHLLLYTVLVTSALSLAATNMLYAIVALAFILPAEKILKQMFNFRNTTGQSLGGFAGGMITKGILDTVARGGKRVAANATNKIRTANNLGIKDPDAPKGASALAGAASLVAGAPAVAQAVQGMAWNANNNGGQANSGMGILGALSGSAQGAAGGDSGTGSQTGAGSSSGAGSPSGIDGNSNGVTIPSNIGGDIGLGSQEGNPVATNGIGQLGDQSGYDNATRIGIQQFTDENGNYLGTRVSVQRPESPYLRANVLPDGTIEAHTNVGNAGLGSAGAGRISGNTGGQRRGFIGGIKNVAGKAYSSVGGAGGIAKMAAKGAARGLVKAGGIAAGTAIGMAAGIVSDDLDNIGKFAIGGALAGNSIGNNAANRVEGVISGAQSVMDTFDQGRYTPEDYARKQLAKQQKEFKRDYKTKQYFKDNFKDKTDAQISDIMDRAATFNSNGIKDLDRIKDAIKLEDGLRDRARQIQGGGEPTQEQLTMAHNEALTLAKIRTDLGESGFNDYKKVRSRKSALTEQLVNNGMTREAAQQRTDDSFNFMESTLNT